ncbi:hypothetical protein EH243_14670 [Amphritea opalescens]|uniref:Polysaccharide pyruvyl transferase domain-containing protein n=1 Tax=Amphritea opalescens TaxID=2490544 RepID=A0A430KN47_9GAMM|nr:polysaccharide pyruvyl transferase family protein [Amphritea opalescens]RTE64921.1 hypothetical protein EH243_14670 [Amphritea opalescens]
MDFFDYKYSRRVRRLLINEASKAADCNDYRKLKRLVTSGLESKYPNVKNVARAKNVILELEHMMQGVGCKNSRIPLWWADTPYPGNLGDSLNPWLINGLTGTPPVKASLITPNVMLAIGSTAQKAEDHTSIWGSGFISKDSPVNPNSNYCAVRGPLSRHMVVKSQGECPDVYGDPAVFMPLIFPRTKKDSGRIGFIPHYIHEHLVKDGDCFTLSVKRASMIDFREFVDDLCECSYVFSSSLHGLILARAYGIPARRVVFSEQALAGDDMKFDDYYLGVGVKNVSDAVDFSQLDNWDEANLKKYRSFEEPVEFNGSNLLSCFPYSDHLVDGIIDRAKYIFA